MVKVILEKYIPVFAELRERIEKDYGKIVSDL